MTEQEAAGLVVRLVCRGRQLDPSQVSGTTDLVDELGFDSLDAAELLAALHKETGLQLDIDSVSDIKKVSDIARSLAGYQSQQKVSERQ
ncbi:MAG TPA: phosphopantetheine-binding protein [Streptosporangiaceae bacterium]|nr:phosphopantetheine-binding protein [Streptosporangiaceae bacterium]